MKTKAPTTKRNSPNMEVRSVLASLRKLGNSSIRGEMSSRYGIATKDAYGVRIDEMQRLAKRRGRSHSLALALWDTGNYEARTVAAFVAEPGQLTPALMDRWCCDFDNWAICDTVCFKLFDQSPHALGRVVAWADRKGEFQKRAAFALLASLALHNDDADDDTFRKLLPLVEAAAIDDRNFVKKGVTWALRAVGGRSKNLETAAVSLATRLASSNDSNSRWIGKDVLRALAPKGPK